MLGVAAASVWLGVAGHSVGEGGMCSSCTQLNQVGRLSYVSCVQVLAPVRWGEVGGLAPLANATTITTMQACVR